MRRGTAAPGYRSQVEARARELNLDVELDSPVAELGVGERQRIEILKALMSDTRVLLLDEPTAVLAPQEVEGLFAVLREVAGAGTAIVLVAHKLDEVLAVADRVTVLRRGRHVLTAAAAGLAARELAEAMVGRRAAAATAGGGGWAAGSGGEPPSVRDAQGEVGRTSHPEPDSAPVAVLDHVTVGTGEPPRSATSA